MVCRILQGQLTSCPFCFAVFLRADNIRPYGFVGFVLLLRYINREAREPPPTGWFVAFWFCLNFLPPAYIMHIQLKNLKFLARDIPPFCTTKASRGLHRSPTGQPAHLRQGGQTVF